MIGKQFNGILNKYTTMPPSGDNEPCVQVVIKHTNAGDIQSLMGHFEKALDTKNIQSVFAYPVMWSKMIFDVSDYHPNYYLVEFDEMEFNAKLQKIEVSKKLDEGIDVFEYNFHFKKEISDGDSKNAYIYLKHKEEDEDGKKVLVEYPVTINLADEPQDTSANADIL
jgi:hypothetical protein